MAVRRLDWPPRIAAAQALRRVADRLAAPPVPMPEDPAPPLFDERRRRLDRLSRDQQDMLYDLAAGASREEMAAGYCLSVRTINYHIQRIRILLELDDTTPLQFRLELRHYARHLPALCDR